MEYNNVSLIIQLADLSSHLFFVITVFLDILVSSYFRHICTYGSFIFASLIFAMFRYVAKYKHTYVL